MMAAIENSVIETNELKSPKYIQETYVIPCLKENDFIVDKLVENIDSKSTSSQYETESDWTRDNYYIEKIQPKYDGDSSNSDDDDDDDIRTKIQIYSCKFCPNKYQKEILWQKHMEMHQQPDKKRECRFCHKIFTTRKYTTEHVRRVHLNVTKYICEKCGKQLFNSGALKMHMRSHYLVKDSSCKYCLKQFENMQELKQHVEENHSPFVCEFCDKRFNLKVSWESHVLMHKNERPFQCSLCPKKYHTADTLRKHRHSVHENIRHDCAFCTQRFTRKQYLMNHVKLVHPEVNLEAGNITSPFPHICNICTRRFLEPVELEAHECSPILKYKCEQCPQRFPLRVRLNKHIRSEHERKICEICKRIIRTENFKKHMQIHSPGYVEKQTCPHCHKDFKTKNFEKHLLTHKKEYVPLAPVIKTRTCPTCNRQYSREKNYLKHLEAHNDIYAQLFKKF